MTRATDKVLLGGVFGVPTTRNPDREQPRTLCHATDWAKTLRVCTEIRFDASTRKPVFGHDAWLRLANRGTVHLHDGRR